VFGSAPPQELEREPNFEPDTWHEPDLRPHRLELTVCGDQFLKGVALNAERMV
jgi:hypothetical protein